MGISLSFQDASNTSTVASSASAGGSDVCLFAVRATIDTATSVSSPVYLQIFDNNSFPVTNDVPVVSKAFAAGSAEVLFGVVGRKMTGNNSIALSSTPLVYTQAAKVGGGNLTALFDVQYV